MAKVSQEWFVNKVLELEMKDLEEGKNDYSEERINMAIVHTRTDVIGISYQLSEILGTLKLILYAIVIGLILILFK